MPKSTLKLIPVDLDPVAPKEGDVWQTSDGTVMIWRDGKAAQDPTLNEVLVGLGFTKRKKGSGYRYDILRDGKVLLEAVSAGEVWAWFEENRP